MPSLPGHPNNGHNKPVNKKLLVIATLLILAIALLANAVWHAPAAIDWATASELDELQDTSRLGPGQRSGVVRHADGVPLRLPPVKFGYHA